MINVFFDCEFTKLQLPLDPVPAALISIGCVSEDNRSFYAESDDFQVEMCTEFVVHTVLPLLEGGVVSMPYTMIAKQLKIWIECFDGEVKMWSDAPSFDWQHVNNMFKNCGWPMNLVRKPISLSFPSLVQQIRFNAGVENAFNTSNPKLRRHHALDDAIANRLGFIVATTRRF